jgi:AcrR family transcriptional regulator
MTLKERILERARARFFQEGFSRVTMEELARELGVSKKTLYSHFSGKHVLLREVMLGLTVDVDRHFKLVLEDTQTGFVEKLQRVLALIGSRLSSLSPGFVADMRLHAPDLWQEVAARREQIIHKRFGSLLRKGVHSRFVRRDIHPQLLILIHTTLIQGIINPESLSQLPLTASQAFEIISRVVFEGILTEEGRKELRGKP